MRKVLLDANLLIAALDNDGTTSSEERIKARQTLTELLSDEDVALVITPLIRYEVLRGIQWQDQTRFEQLKQSLNGFTELEVSRDVSELATNLFRFDRAENLKQNKHINKRNFDVFHFATAKHHQLEFASRDTDMTVLANLYERYINRE